MVVQRTCDSSVQRQLFMVRMNADGRALLCLSSYTLCLGHGGGYRSGDRLTASTQYTMGSQVKWVPVTSDYRRFHITVVENRSLAIDLSITGGGHLENKKIQFYTSSPGKLNQQWEFIKFTIPVPGIPDMGW